MLTSTKHRFSVEDYHRMAETGVLSPNVRVELLAGEITDMSPIGPFHGGVTNCLAKIFFKAAGDRWEVAVQTPVQLDDHSEPQPDLMLLKPAADFHQTGHPRPEDVYLLVEISDTTLDRDVSEKLPAYGRAGILEVWIVNLIDKTLEIYGEPHFAGYGSKRILQAGEVARPQAFPDFGVAIAEFLKAVVFRLFLSEQFGGVVFDQA